MDIQVGTQVFRLSAPTSAIKIVDEAYIISSRSFTIDHPWGFTEFFRHGWNSWSPTRWWHIADKPWRVWNNPNRTLTADDVASDDPQVHTSYMVTALCGSEGKVMLIGALRGQSPVLRINDQQIFCEAESETMWMFTVGTESEVFTVYTNALAKERQLTPLPRINETIGPIWSSWYSWFEEITDNIINDEIIPARELGYGAIQIDDGWERRVGDWRPNEKFPTGIADLSSRIHDAGLKTGIWLAPFIALPNTPVLGKYPELFLKDASGELMPVGYNWGEYYYGLDFSQPAAHELLFETVTEIVSWGIDVFKLDFIYAAALQAERVGNMNREEAYRAGLQTIRDAVGSDVYLLGSGAVINASFGILNGIRVGPDTAPYWDNTERKGDPTGPSVLNALRSSLSRTWLKPLIDCDPDVGYFRTRGSLLSPEINALTVDATLVCEFAQCSDPKAWLNDEESVQVKQWTKESCSMPTINQLERYKYTINEREVNFEPYLNSSGRMSDRLLVK